MSTILSLTLLPLSIGAAGSFIKKLGTNSLEVGLNVNSFAEALKAFFSPSAEALACSVFLSVVLMLLKLISTTLLLFDLFFVGSNFCAIQISMKSLRLTEKFYL